MTTPDLHRGQGVARLGPDLAAADSAMILVHGRGADARSILELGRLLRNDSMTCVAPQAANHTWYPTAFIAPLAKNQPWLDSALDVVAELVTEVEEAGIRRERIVLCGFSQGACLGSEFVSRNPERWGGLLVFSGGRIGPLGMEFTPTGDLDGTPVFMGCSDRDPHIPLERFEQTGEYLEAVGAEVDLRVYEGMPHTIIQEEIDAARAVVEGLRGP